MVSPLTTVGTTVPSCNELCAKIQLFFVATSCDELCAKINFALIFFISPEQSSKTHFQTRISKTHTHEDIQWYSSILFLRIKYDILICIVQSLHSVVYRTIYVD